MSHIDIGIELDVYFVDVVIALYFNQTFKLHPITSSGAGVWLEIYVVSN